MLRGREGEFTPWIDRRAFCAPDDARYVDVVLWGRRPTPVLSRMPGGLGDWVTGGGVRATLWLFHTQSSDGDLLHLTATYSARRSIPNSHGSSRGRRVRKSSRTIAISHIPVLCAHRAPKCSSPHAPHDTHCLSLCCRPSYAHRPSLKPPMAA